MALEYNTYNLQIHWPVTEPQIPGDEIQPSLRETWEAMEKLVDQVGAFLSEAQPCCPDGHRHHRNDLHLL